MIRLLQVLFMLGSVLLGLCVATQWSARQLAYAPELGYAWVTLRDVQLYAPHAFIAWTRRYHQSAPTVFRQGYAFILGGSLVGITATLVLRLWAGRGAEPPTTYGSSRWARRQDLEQAGLLGNDGVMLGGCDRAIPKLQSGSCHLGS